MNRCDAGCGQRRSAARQSRYAAVRSGIRGWSLGVITLDAALFEDTIERFNVTLPRRVLKRLDAMARAAGVSRSSYIAHLTLDVPDGGMEQAA